MKKRQKDSAKQKLQTAEKEIKPFVEDVVLEEIDISDLVLKQTDLSDVVLERIDISEIEPRRVDSFCNEPELVIEELDLRKEPDLVLKCVDPGEEPEPALKHAEREKEPEQELKKREPESVRKPPKDPELVVEELDLEKEPDLVLKSMGQAEEAGPSGQEYIDTPHPEDTKKKRGKGKKKSALIVLLLLGLAGGGFLYRESLVYRVCRAEAGVPVAASEFLKNGDPKACFTENSQPFDTAVPGEYKVQVKSGFFTYQCTLLIQDTTPPEALTHPVTLTYGETCGAESFVSGIEDATEVVVSYEEEPDFGKTGRQQVRIVLSDLGNNRTMVRTDLLISPFQKEITVEAGGEAPDITAFLTAGGQQGQGIRFVSPIGAFDYTKTEDYTVILEAAGEQYESVMHIEDTIPPRIEVQDMVSYQGVPLNMEGFLVSVEDVTETTAGFRTDPDLSLAGTQDLELVVTDSGGNEASEPVKLTILEDKEPPVITGAKDMVVYMGDSASYRKGVSVKDNSNADIKLEVDSAGVDLQQEGVYPVTYTARDYAGNTAEATIQVEVRKRKYDIETVNTLADEVLASILTPEMSQYDQALAIYRYVRSHIGYVNHSEKGDWVQAAYEGLTLKRGDCYIYACTSKVLLTRAGIPNLDIKKIPSKSRHYWSLVDVGEGWRHFDTTPRNGGGDFFLLTEEELMAYSAAHWNSHNYDHAQYPEVK